MTAKLHISDITIQNYKGFGDCITIPLDNLGPVLITGKNGVGKTTAFADAIVWCLFGRTINNPRPADRVVNWERGHSTLVQIRTKDGWIIKRTRKMAGHNDLLIYMDGDEKTRSTNDAAQQFITNKFNLDYDIFISSILFGQKGASLLKLTDKKRKEAIERMLMMHVLNVRSGVAAGLMKEKQDKLATLNAVDEGFERDQDRIEQQIISSKESGENFEVTRKTRKTKIHVENDQLKEKATRIKDVDREEYQKKWAAIDKVQSRLLIIQKQRRDAQLEVTRLKAGEEAARKHLLLYEYIDLDKLKEGIATIEEIDAINAHEMECAKELRKLDTAKNSIERDIRRVESDVAAWESKLKHKICPNCEQEIQHGHVDEKCYPLQEGIARHKAALVPIEEKIHVTQTDMDRAHEAHEQFIGFEPPTCSIEEAIEFNKEVDRMKSEQQEKAEALEKKAVEVKKFAKQIEKAMTVLEQNKPDFTLEQIDLLVERREGYLRRIEENKRTLWDIRKEENPYDEVVRTLEAESLRSKARRVENQRKIDNMNTIIRHLDYMKKAYGDRRRIKKMLLADRIPYLNKRIKYHGDVFDLAIDLKFTNTLGLDSTTWDYSECSGGQQCRIDVAVMFAVYDLMISIYGQQCNIMIMDEVDKELDDDGVPAFVEAVMRLSSNDKKPSTIFVMSHKTTLKSAFPREITLTMEDGYSKINSN